LKNSPGWAIADGESEGRDYREGQGIGVEGDGWTSKGLRPGDGGEDLLGQWMGWSRGRHYEVTEGGLEFIGAKERPKFKL
jgi:alpha-methylacyl-CoA racemase